MIKIQSTETKNFLSEDFVSSKKRLIREGQLSKSQLSKTQMSKTQLSKTQLCKLQLSKLQLSDLQLSKSQLTKNFIIVFCKCPKQKIGPKNNLTLLISKIHKTQISKRLFERTLSNTYDLAN
jgi:hypothetical protein